MSIAKSSLIAWVLFGAGIAVVFAGFVVWTSLTGVSWWTSPNKALADRVLSRFVAVAFLVSAIAPFFSTASLARRFLLSVLAAAAVVVGRILTLPP
jgi:hypothetical protein